MGFKKKNDKTKDNIQEVSKDNVKKNEVSEEISENEKNKTPEDVSENTKKEASEDVSENTKKKASEDASEDTKKEEKKQKKKKDKGKAKKRKKRKKDRKPEEVNIVKELLSLIIYIGIVVLLCFIIINFVGCRSRVDGESMMNTLNDGDNLWVDKLSYTFGDPKRFDVIIFNYNENTTYVKRIIGLPGETVRIDHDGKIYINEKLLVENYGRETIKPNNLGRANQPVLLGEDEYFVLGDNRNNSSDSRWADVGNVHREDIVGKVMLRIYPFKDFGSVK